VIARLSSWSIATGLVFACGVPGCAQEPDTLPLGSAGVQPTGGAGQSTGGGGQTTGTGGAQPMGSGGQTLGTAGQATAGRGTDLEPPLVDISGRWGMFLFEDPVAVDIVQNGNGITGLGCDAGLPDPEPDPASTSIYCAPLRGEVEADRAWFAFDISSYAFRAEVTVSRDASRMAGEFLDIFGDRYKSSWLRLRDDEIALVRRWPRDQSAIDGRYDLRLMGSVSSESSFDPLRTYEITYIAAYGIYGDLGAFYYTEISGDETPSEPLLVGPVPPADPTVPVSIRFDRNASRLTHATVVDVHGVVSEFEVLRTP
jgi:hypothetical protein